MKSLSQYNFKKYLFLALGFILSTLFVCLFFTIPAQAAGTSGVQVALANNQSLVTVWNTLINIANSVIIVVLIFVAFAEILRIQIDTYAFKKLLPTLLWAIILANFSFLVCRIMVDFSNVAVSLFGTSNAFSSAFQNWKIPFLWINPWEGFLNLLIQLFSFLGVVVAAFILAFLFFIRNYVIYFLVAVSPLAFIAMALPFTKKFFDQWWGQFLRWVFLPVPSVALLWMMGQFLDNFGTEPLLRAAFSAVCLYGAIILPFQLGGPIMQKWGEVGKKAWGATGGSYLNRQWGHTKNQFNSGTGIFGKVNKSGAPHGWVRRNTLGRIGDLGKGISTFRAGGALKNELPKLVEEKINKTNRTDAALRMLLSKSSTEWKNDTNRAAYSRLKAVVRQYNLEEISSTSKTGATSDLIDLSPNGSVLLRNDGKAANAEDVAKAVFEKDYSTITPGAQAIIQNKLSKGKAASDILAEHTAAVLEIQRRNSSKSVDDALKVPAETFIIAHPDLAGGLDPANMPGSAVGQVVGGQQGAPMPAGAVGGVVPVEIVRNHDQTIESGFQHIQDHILEAQNIAGGVRSGENFESLRQDIGSFNMDSTEGIEAFQRRMAGMDSSLSSMNPDELREAHGRYQEAFQMIDRVPQNVRSQAFDSSTELGQAVSAMQQSLQETVRNHAASVSTGEVAARALENQSGTVNSVLANPETMNQLTEAIQGLHGSIGELSGRESLSAEDIGKAMKETMVNLPAARGGLAGNAPITAVMGRTPTERKIFAEAIGRAVAAEAAKKPLKVQATNMPTA